MPRRCTSTCSFNDIADATRVIILTCQRQGAWHRYFGQHQARTETPTHHMRSTWDRHDDRPAKKPRWSPPFHPNARATAYIENGIYFGQLFAIMGVATMFLGTQPPFGVERGTGASLIALSLAMGNFVYVRFWPRPSRAIFLQEA